MPISLTGRLLCAAQQAYEIVSSGPAPASPATPSPPPSTLVGWIAAPQCHVSGDDGVSAVLVGETATEVIVAYRGTEPFNSLDTERMVLDWVDDFITPLVASPNVGGSVHQGFSHAVDGLWSWLEATVAALPRTKPLYLTGHSKGGALANIAAVKLVVAGFTPFVCTFEAARAGDPAFAADFAAKVSHATRYEYQSDIVPMLPPSDAFLPLFKRLPMAAQLANTFIPNYVPVGDLRFINWRNQIVGDSPALEAQRISAVMTELSSLDCGVALADHSIAPGSGAAAVICGALWGPAPAPSQPAGAPGPPPPDDIPF
jgi:hypothetical protein